MNKYAGYTLIELLITVTITTILITIGVTAYGRAAEIQAIKSDSETILGLLTSAQKAATSGKADCVTLYGRYLGETLTTSSNSPTITITSTCESGSGAVETYTLSRFNSVSSSSILFRPLNQGIDTGASSSLNLDFTINNDTYRFLVEQSGTIKSLGKITQ